jgi:CelD/BcsL family acetyltransferase involved in cellulose biosynthesis
MNIRVVKPSELTPDNIDRWRTYQRQSAVLSNPFFSPQYVEAVGQVQPGVRVGIVENENEIVGFFPFQLAARNIADQVGLRLCDLSGPILKTDVVVNPESLVRGCRLAGWHFQNLVQSGSMQPYQWAQAESPFLDLTGGFDSYKRDRKEAGSALFEELARKSRKLHREAGALRFEFHTGEQAVFDQLMKWKAAQRAETKTFNVLTMHWARALLNKIRDIQTAEFAGVLSVLYAGDQMAAVHLGMRSRNVFHYWIPAYNPELAKYSPGAILLLEMAMTASATGVTRIDLGTGNEKYKQRFKSGSLTLSFGSVNCSLSSAVLSRIRCASHKCRDSSLLYFGFASFKNVLQRVYHRTVIRPAGLKGSEV